MLSRELLSPYLNAAQAHCLAVRLARMGGISDQCLPMFLSPCQDLIVAFQHHIAQSVYDLRPYCIENEAQFVSEYQAAFEREAWAIFSRFIYIDESGRDVVCLQDAFIQNLGPLAEIFNRRTQRLREEHARHPSVWAMLQADPARNIEGEHLDDETLRRLVSVWSRPDIKVISYYTLASDAGECRALLNQCQPDRPVHILLSTARAPDVVVAHWVYAQLCYQDVGQDVGQDVAHIQLRVIDSVADYEEAVFYQNMVVPLRAELLPGYTLVPDYHCCNQQWADGWTCGYWALYNCLQTVVLPDTLPVPLMEAIRSMKATMRRALFSSIFNAFQPLLRATLLAAAVPPALPAPSVSDAPSVVVKFPQSAPRRASSVSDGLIYEDVALSDAWLEVYQAFGHIADQPLTAHNSLSQHLRMLRSAKPNGYQYYGLQQLPAGQRISMTLGMMHPEVKPGRFSVNRLKLPWFGRVSVVDTQVVDQPLPLLLSQESMQFLKAMPLKAVRAFWGWLDVLQSACCRGSLSFQNIQVQVIAVGKGQYLYCLNERHAHLVYLDRCVSLERVTARIRPSKQQLSMVAQYHADLQALKNAVQDVLSSQDRPQQQVIVSDVNVPQQAKVQGGHGGITAGVFTVSDGRSVRYLRKVTNCVEVSAYYAFRSNPKLAPYIPQLYRTEIVAQRSQQRVCVQLIEDAAGLAALEQAEAVALKQPIAKRGKDKHKARILMEDLLDGANPDDFYIVDLKLFVLDGEGEWGHIRDDAEGRANLGHGKGGFNRLLMDLQPRLAQIEGAPGLVTRGDKLTRQFQFLESSRIFYTEVLEHLQLSELQDLVKQILDMMQGLSDKQTSAIGSSFFFIVHKRGAVGAKMRFIDFGHFLDNDNLNIAPAELQRLHDGFLNGIRLVLKAVLKMVFKRVVERYLGQQYVEQLVFFGSDAVRRETQAAMLRLQTAVCRSERIPATVLSCVTSLVPYLVQDDPAHGLLSRDEVCCAEADSLLTEMQAHMRRSSFFDAFPQLHADEAQTLQVAGVDLPG